MAPDRGRIRVASQEARWHPKEITEKEWSGDSSHVGFLIPVRAWGDDFEAAFAPLPVYFNDKRVVQAGKDVRVTKPHADPKRHETRVQALSRLKEMGLTPGLIEVRVGTDRLEIRQGSEQRAWLVMAAGDERSHGGNDGYDDLDGEYYSWDSTVPRHEDVQQGDMIVVWNKQGLVGMSFIESISKNKHARKISNRCPQCGKAGIKKRKTKPDHERWRCHECKTVFGVPDESIISVKTYRSNHATWWADLRGLIPADKLRSLVIGSPRQQHSIRPLHWVDFCEELGRSGVVVADLPAVRRRAQVTQANNSPGGFRETMTRTRLGQGAFREKLLKRFGNTCALTGAQPPEVLQAAHLYSYAELAKHEDHGGLLMRADIHLLFDRGLIGISGGRKPIIWVSPDLEPHSTFWQLSGQPAQVRLGHDERRWLGLHQQEHFPER